MGFECVRKRGRQEQCTPAPVGLRFNQLQLPVDPLQRNRNPQCPRLTIHILPAQAKRFALPQTE